jgi:hypothetical protein
MMRYVKLKRDPVSFVEGGSAHASDAARCPSCSRRSTAFGKENWKGRDQLPESFRLGLNIFERMEDMAVDVSGLGGEDG